MKATKDTTELTDGLLLNDLRFRQDGRRENAKIVDYVPNPIREGTRERRPMSDEYLLGSMKDAVCLSAYELNMTWRGKLLRAAVGKPSKTSEIRRRWLVVPMFRLLFPKLFATMKAVHG